MNKRQAYNLGKEHGYNVASWVDLPELGSKIDRCLDWIGLGDVVTSDNVADYFALLAHVSEDNSGQFSPFEFTAHDFNECSNAESLWDEFDKGIDRGIAISWQERKSYYDK